MRRSRGGREKGGAKLRRKGKEEELRRKEKEGQRRKRK